MKMKPLAYTVFMKMKEKENRHFRMWPPRLGINANLEAISNTHTHIYTFLEESWKKFIRTLSNLGAISLNCSENFGGLVKSTVTFENMFLLSKRKKSLDISFNKAFFFLLAC